MIKLVTIFSNYFFMIFSAYEFQHHQFFLLLYVYLYIYISDWLCIHICRMGSSFFIIFNYMLMQRKVQFTDYPMMIQTTNLDLLKSIENSFCCLSLQVERHLCSAHTLKEIIMLHLLTQIPSAN